jgi:hypothetical protein
MYMNGRTSRSDDPRLDDEHAATEADGATVDPDAPARSLVDENEDAVEPNEPA